MYVKKIKELEDILGISFTNKDLIKEALTHSSYANEIHGEDGDDYIKARAGFIDGGDGNDTIIQKASGGNYATNLQILKDKYGATDAWIMNILSKPVKQTDGVITETHLWKNTEENLPMLKQATTV